MRWVGQLERQLDEFYNVMLEKGAIDEPALRVRLKTTA
jgi:hypothetical protein